MVGLEALTGALDDFGFEDYLNGTQIVYNMPTIMVDYCSSSLDLDDEFSWEMPLIGLTFLLIAICYLDT